MVKFDESTARKGAKYVKDRRGKKAPRKPKVESYTSRPRNKNMLGGSLTKGVEAKKSQRAAARKIAARRKKQKMRKRTNSKHAYR